MRLTWPIPRAWASATLVAAGVAAAQPAPAGTITPERQGALMNLLKQDCGSCHGMTMKGGLGPALLPETLRDKPTDALTAIILDGVHGLPMPPWRPFLAPAEAAWMVERLKEGLK